MRLKRQNDELLVAAYPRNSAVDSNLMVKAIMCSLHRPIRKARFKMQHSIALIEWTAYPTKMRVVLKRGRLREHCHPVGLSNRKRQ